MCFYMCVRVCAPAGFLSRKKHALDLIAVLRLCLLEGCVCECDSEDRTFDDGRFAHPLQDDVPTPVFGEPKPGTTAPANQKVLRIRPLLAVFDEIGKVLQLPAGRESGISRRQHQ